MFLNAANNDPFYSGNSLFSQDSLKNAADYGINLVDNYGKYTGQTGQGMLLPKTAKQKLQAKKAAAIATTKATTKATEKTSPSEYTTVLEAPKKLDIKEWLSGSVYVAGKNVPRKVLVGIAVSGILLIVLGSIGKKTVIEAVR